MALAGAHAPGATPIEPEDLEDLIPDTVTTQSDLNEWEAEHRGGSNLAWSATQMAEPHVRKYLEVGGDPSPARDDNASHQLGLATNPQDIDQAAARLHHRIVLVHAFRNGNGRHARLLTDRVLRVRGIAPFSWGRANLVKTGPVRSAYIAALRAADGGAFEQLFALCGVELRSATWASQRAVKRRTSHWRGLARTTAFSQGDRLQWVGQRPSRRRA